MASSTGIRESTNLIHRDAAPYSSSKTAALVAWLSELQEKPSVLSLPSDKQAASNLIKNKDFRIDCQGYFEVPGYDNIGWVNLQVQENVPRVKGASTTVITTYVHFQGYRDLGMITSNIILQAMKQQVLHTLSEYVIFVSKSQQGHMALQNIPRGPNGVLDRGWGSLDLVRKIQGEQKWKQGQGKWATIWVPEA
ncbi:hypothetical protein V492_04695 [Pseudogymnoascus sp. VKM F-4246]|nr:hypothetical protein V492_04695 [Pseudogymnoascus sp. VKM F-4246]